MSKTFLVDTTRCTACRGCQLACKDWHGLPANKTKQTGTHQNPPDLNINNYKIVRFHEHLDENNKVVWNFFPDQCRHCLYPPCVDVANAYLEGAMFKDEVTGAVLCDKEVMSKMSDEVAESFEGFEYSCPYQVPRFDSVLSASAKVMLPLLKEQEYLAPFIPTLETYFIVQRGRPKATETPEEKAKKVALKTKAPYNTYQLAEAYLANNPDVIEKTAEYLNVPSQALLFAFHFILSPALQALVMHSLPQVIEDEVDAFGLEETSKSKEEAPWDKNGKWKEGYCPVCASFPSISYLDRALLDENNQFLASGGGKKNLHCSLCGTNWHFKRGCCPNCKEEGPDVMEIMKESKTESGERIDWCTKCKSYCPNVDLRVNGKRPNFDMMALGLLHLDMIAAEKQLTPLTPSFWNTFNTSEG